MKGSALVSDDKQKRVKKSTRGGETNFFPIIIDPFVVGIIGECELDCIDCTVDIPFGERSDEDLWHGGGWEWGTRPSMKRLIECCRRGISGV